jgi:threonine/homoserine/homoserine lactone efflux protein
MAREGGFMEWSAFFALVGASLASSAAPGPVILTVISRSVTHGQGSGLQVALGYVLAKAMLLGLAAAILGGVLSISDGMFDGVRLVGLLLLVGLAVLMLRADPLAAGLQPVQGRIRLGEVATGLALGVTSPYVLVFVVALLPQFLDLTQIDAAEWAMAAAAVLIGAALPMVTAALCATKLLRPSLRQARIVARSCGVALLGFAGLAVVAAP